MKKDKVLNNSFDKIKKTKIQRINHNKLSRFKDQAKAATHKKVINLKDVAKFVIPFLKQNWFFNGANS